MLTSLLGFWGEPTANIDFCEENYALSPWVAEFWNAISSFSFVVVAALGMWACASFNLETRFVVAYIATAVLGLGSALFHATLLHSMQLLDELPMIWAVLSGIFIIFTIDVKDGHDHPPKLRYLPAALAITAFLFTLSEIFLSNYPEIFQVAFSLIASFLAYRCIRYTLRTKHAAQYSWMMQLSLFCYLVGCQLWILEAHMCNKLAHLQLHAWWHILRYLLLVCGCSSALFVFPR